MTYQHCLNFRQSMKKFKSTGKSDEKAHMKNLLFITLLFTSFSLWSQDRCTGNFVSTAEKHAELERWIGAKALDQNTVIYVKYKNLIEANPNAVAPYLKNFAYDVLLDQEMLSTAKSFERVIDNITESLVAHPNLSADDRLRAAIQKNLEGKVPAETIATRVNEFMGGGSIYRALGENTLAETAVMFHGGNALAPTADSALGKFLAKHTPATVVRKFKHGEPVYQGEGPDKLVVAIDSNSLADFVALMKDEHLFAHYHTPNQGTLYVLHQDKLFSYNGSAGFFSEKSANFGESQMEMLFPTMLMSSTESQRLTQYLSALSNEQLTYYAQHPWRLTGYCATGGYNSCTHWFGNIPLGDEKVTAYTFPGNFDDAAGNAPRLEGGADKLPRTQDLVAHNFPATTNLTENNKELISRVWKTPGNKQLSYLMGLGKAQERGELANPGWVAQVLLSRTKADRSPVVFIFTPNAKEALAADFIPKISPR